MGELLYEAEIHFTKVVEYGVSIESISSGDIGDPLEGARFDQTFHGDLHGPRLNGTISGIDYLYVRADGRFQLHIHAQITTDDGVEYPSCRMEFPFKKQTQGRHNCGQQYHYSRHRRNTPGSIRCRPGRSAR